MKVTVEFFKQSGKHYVVETYDSSLPCHENVLLEREVRERFKLANSMDHTIEVDDQKTGAWNKFLIIL